MKQLSKIKSNPEYIIFSFYFFCSFGLFGALGDPIQRVRG